MDAAKIINALNVIKKTCEDAVECNVCALGTEDGQCRVTDDIPVNWEVVDPVVVRLMG